MIRYLSGKILKKEPPILIVLNNGIGYEVYLSLRDFQKLPETNSDIELYIFTYLKENQIKLFGFLDDFDREIFIEFVQIPKIGPRIALNLISFTDTKELIEIILKEDLQTLSKIPGIGKRTGERIIYECKEKFKNLINLKEEEIKREKILISDKDFDMILSALVNLGYRKTEALTALNYLKKLEGLNNLSLTEKITKALHYLKGKK